VAIENIVVAVDFSEVSGRVLEQAELLARALGARLWLVHVAAPEPAFVGYEPGPQTVRDSVASHIHEHHHQLQEQADALRARGIEATALHVQGPTVEKILSEAGKLGAELIVVGSHGRGALYRALLGSVSEGVLRGARCPVHIVPARERG
jgi:nucleotide-binding universal stress UspA family protein